MKNWDSSQNQNESLTVIGYSQIFISNNSNSPELRFKLKFYRMV